MKPIVWIDLEDTVINSWHDMQLIPQKVSAIRKWLASNKIREIGIWSFAILDDKDKHDFDTMIKDELMATLEVLITDWPSIPEMRKLVHSFEHIEHESDCEFTSLNGKLFSFMKFAMLHKDAHFVLIDDAVPSLEMFDKDKNLKISFMNIDRDFKGM